MSSGHITFQADVNCYYTLTTIKDVTKPSLPSTVSTDPRPEFFPLPFIEDFEGETVGGEAAYFGDQEGKWETVAASQWQIWDWESKPAAAARTQRSLAYRIYPGTTVPPCPLLETCCSSPIL